MTTATPIEVKKIAYRQSAKDGLVITFAIHPDDMPSSLAAAKIGARFMAALVEIGDDEKPVERAKEKRNWDDLPSATQAGIRCGEKAFQRFVVERGYAPDDLGPEISGEDLARAGILTYCGINSRGELSRNSDKARLWQQMDTEFLAWGRGDI